MAQPARQLKAIPATLPSSKPQALQLVESPRPARPLALIMVLFLILLIFALIYVPWQQSITGVGQIIVFSPNDRPQNVQSQIPGRLKGWKVKEGDFVEAGMVIAEIAEIDAKFLDPNQLERLERQREFLFAQREAAQSRAAALLQQIKALEQSRNLAIPAAEERARQAADRLRSAEQALEAAKQKLLADELNFERIRDLNKGKKTLTATGSFNRVSVQTATSSWPDRPWKHHALMSSACKPCSTPPFVTRRWENSMPAGLKMTRWLP